MIEYIKKLFVKKIKNELIASDGCPKKCPTCGTKAIRLTRHLDTNKTTLNKYITCSICRISLAEWENDKWIYSTCMYN
jgi:hypothetical protein